MPLAQIKGISGFLSTEQKQALIRGITDAIVAVEGEGMRPLTLVIIEDVNSGEWGIAGEPVTLEAARSMAMQN